MADVVSDKSPEELLKDLLEESSKPLTSKEFAEFLDKQDSLSELRRQFLIPKNGDQTDYDGGYPDEDTVYLLGNSLGLQPVRTRTVVNEQLDKWAKKGIEGHFEDPLAWFPIGETVADIFLPIVGGQSRREVAVMNSLTVNLHLLLVAFYRPTEQRHKIVIEKQAFPSDRYAVCSQIKQRGGDPDKSFIELTPRSGESVIRFSDIEELFDREGDSIAVLMLGGVQFFSGQLFDMEQITKLCHKHGCYAGFDLAHAVGNVPLHLHDWDVDFACWCTYKYLNSGPGGIGGAFIHERHAEDFAMPRFAGWWGNDPQFRFNMEHDFKPSPGVPSFQLSNVPMLSAASLAASLEVFNMTSMEELRRKSLLLTCYMELLLIKLVNCSPGPSLMEEDSCCEPASKKAKPAAEILTPRDADHRGCQLSLRFTTDVARIQKGLMKEGIITDIRKPDVIRVAPVPLYNRFADVHRFVTTLASLCSI